MDGRRTTTPDGAKEGVPTMETNADPDAPLVCARCGAALRPGFGDYYEVTIEAVADPTPPQLPPPDLAGDLRREIERLLARLRDVSEHEAMAQVYLRRRITLCAPCCRLWIEHPVG
jgi:hypothetical protein